MEVIERRAARLAAEGVHIRAVHYGGMPASRRRRHATRADRRPLRRVQVEPEEVVQRSPAIVAAKHVHHLLGLVDDGGRGGARAGAVPVTRTEYPLFRLKAELVPARENEREWVRIILLRCVLLVWVERRVRTDR